MTARRATSTPPDAAEIDYPRIGLIGFGHLANDLFGNLMTSLTPYLVIRGQISLAMAGLVLLIYLAGSSVLQPIFGLLSDQSGRRYFAVFGPFWIGLAASLFGWAGNGLIILLLAGLGGIGTAAFHPQAATMVNHLSPRSKGWTMSLFSMGGNIGFACGPVLAAVIAGVGLHWSLVVLAPAVALTALLALFAPLPPSSGPDVTLATFKDAALSVWRRLSLVVGVIAIRSGAQYALIVFLPLYFHARGFPAQLGSLYAFVLSFSGALGGLVGGHLSDLFGRRVVVVGSLVMAAPLILLSLLTPGPVVWLLLVLSGAALLASNSVTVVQGQELLPDNPGVASGLTLGLGFGLSGVVTSTLTFVSQRTGVETAILFVPLLPLIAAALGSLVGPGPRTAGATGGRASPARAPSGE